MFVKTGGTCKENGKNYKVSSHADGFGLDALNKTQDCVMASSPDVSAEMSAWGGCVASNPAGFFGCPDEAAACEAK